MRNSKRLGLFVTVFTCLFLCVGGQAQAQAQSKVKVLVLPFVINASGDKEALRKSVGQLLAERFKEQGASVAVADSPDVLKLLKGAEPSVSVARAAGRSGGAAVVVYGSVNEVGGGISVDAKALPVKGNAQPVSAYATRGGVMELASAMDEVVQKLPIGKFVAATGGSAVAAPSGGSGLSGVKVAQVDVEGNDTLDKDVILLKVKTQVGEPFDAGTVNEDLKRLMALGYFDDVQVKTEDVAGGKRVVFVVKEKPRILAISVTGNSDIKTNDILAAMETRSGSVLNMQTLADDLEKIRDLYRKKGYYQTTVDYKLEQTDPRQARLNIVVKEAKKIYIKKIDIVGAKQVSASDLRGVMALKEKGFLSWVLQTGVLKEELLDRDSAAIENYYTNHGYIDARVGQPQVDIQNDGIVITFRVEEGERYRVGSVNFKGDLLLDEKKLHEITKMPELAQKKAYFDRSVARDDVTNLKNSYSDMGYAFADANVDLQKRPNENVVDVTYVLNKGQKVYVRRVTIEGNDRTRENVIRRELRLADGDVLSGTALARSNARLNKLDYFDKVDIEAVSTEDPSQVDIKVKVKDKNTGTISAGVGYSTSDSVFVGGSIEERNLFGKGYQASLQGQFSTITNRFVASFTNPALYDSDLAAGIDAFSTFRQYSDFYRESQGGGLHFGYPVGEFTNLRWGYQLSRDRVYHTNWNASSVIAQSRGVHWTSSVMAGISRDTTDSRTMPTTGTLNDFSVQYAGLGGDRGFIRLYYNFNYYHPVVAGIIFHARAQAGTLFENGHGSVPVFERFYLGGIGDIRGYESMKISPKDHNTNERIGGDTTYFANLEAIFPLVKQYGLYGVGFFDAGNSIWVKRDGFNPTLVKSVGGGVRWLSPMGLIRVEGGYALDTIEHHQQNFQIGFAMGNTF